MTVMIAMLLKSTNSLFESSISQNAVLHTVWIGPAPLCAMRYITHTQHLPGYEALYLEPMKSALNTNVEFNLTGDLGNAFILKSYKSQTVTATSNLAQAENMFTDYQNSYVFFSRTCTVDV